MSGQEPISRARIRPARPAWIALLVTLILLGACASARAATGARATGGVRPRSGSSGAPRANASARVHVTARGYASAHKGRKGPGRKKGPGGLLAAELRADPERAIAAYQAMQTAYFIPGSGGLYTGEPYSFLWPFSQALAVTVSLDEIPHQARTAVARYNREAQLRLSGLEKYWGPAGQTLPGEPTEEEEEAAEPPEEGDNFVTTMPSYNGNVVPPGGISYYDDNEWVGLELVRLYKRTHEPALLERAEQVMAFVMDGWQSNPNLACPGGVPFSDSPDNTDRNTITDGPAAELGVQLYWVTRNASYLQFAETAYQWVRTCLLDPSWLYADHIRTHGTVVDKLWSYTQGVMIGAGTMLYQATHNATYLGEARQTAKAALAYFTLPRLEEESPFFPAVYFRNLLYLDSITHDPPGPKLAQAYVDHVWAYQRSQVDLFLFGSPPAPQLLWQGAIAQVYALLSEPASRYF